MAVSGRVISSYRLNLLFHLRDPVTRFPRPCSGRLPYLCSPLRTDSPSPAYRVSPTCHHRDTSKGLWDLSPIQRKQPKEVTSPLAATGCQGQPPPAEMVHSQLPELGVKQLLLGLPIAPPPEAGTCNSVLLATLALPTQAGMTLHPP